MAAGGYSGASRQPRSGRQSAELLYLLVLKELRVRYKNSVLGYVWALANPLAYTLVYYVAFRLIMRVQIPNYGVYLVTGLFPWSWMASTLVQSAGIYRSNESLIRKVRIQRAILPLSSAVHEMVHFFFAMPVLVIAVGLATGHFHLSWVVLAPLMALVQLAVIYPLGLILAVTNVIVRDVEYLVQLGLQMLFFLTPIVYPAESIPIAYRPYFLLNPFHHMISAWRSILYSGTLPFADVGFCLAFAFLAGGVAWLTHSRLDRRIGELL